MAKTVKQKNKKKTTKESSLINLDNEIIIGIKTLPQPETPKKKKQNKSKSKTTKNKTNKGNQKKKNAKKQQTQKKKKNNSLKVIKWTSIILILLGGTIYFLLSPFFNIKEIKTTGNTKISREELVSLSGIQLEENSFKIRNSQIQDNIKQNAYVESVKIKRKLPSTIEIQISERTPTYMISLANAYVYINNQGYFLEVSKEKLNLPILVGYSTQERDIHVGSRLCTEDLQKLNDVLQIIKAAESNEISNLVTKINISNKNNYIIELKPEKKTVNIGDCSNLSTKMLYIKSILEENKNIEGEIFVNTDLNNKGAIFRKKI